MLSSAKPASGGPFHFRTTKRGVRKKRILDLTYGTPANGLWSRSSSREGTLSANVSTCSGNTRTNIAPPEIPDELRAKVEAAGQLVPQRRQRFQPVPASASGAARQLAEEVHPAVKFGDPVQKDLQFNTADPAVASHIAGAVVRSFTTSAQLRRCCARILVHLHKLSLPTSWRSIPMYVRHCRTSSTGSG